MDSSLAMAPTQSCDRAEQNNPNQQGNQEEEDLFALVAPVRAYNQAYQENEREQHLYFQAAPVSSTFESQRYQSPHMLQNTPEISLPQFRYDTQHGMLQLPRAYERPPHASWPCFAS